MTVIERALQHKYTTFPSLRLYDLAKVPYVVTSSEWNGAVWTGHCMMLSTHGPDEFWFHELAHWLLASPDQRKLPDYGLGRNVDAGTLGVTRGYIGADFTFATSSTPFLFDDRMELGKLEDDLLSSPRMDSLGRNFGWGEETVFHPEAERQEGLAVDAMLLYRPMCRLEAWESDGTPKVPEVAASFGAEVSQWKNFIQDLWQQIVLPLHPRTRVSLQQVRSYLSRMEAPTAMRRKELELELKRSISSPTAK